MAQLNNNTIETIKKELIKNGLETSIVVLLETFLNEVMYSERTEYLNANPYERTKKRCDYGNGFKPKKINTRAGTLNLKIPQTRNSGFYPACLEKGMRSEKALYATIAEMYIQGVSTRKVNKILKELCGLNVSSTEVSRCTKKLDVALEQFRSRPLSECCYIILDARYEHVRYGGIVQNLAVIWAIGITKFGQKEVLGVSVSLSEAEAHWDGFMSNLKERGLTKVKYAVSDDHKGLKAALDKNFAGIIWNRCHFHLGKNAQSYVRKKKHKEEVAQDIRNILDAPDLEAANYFLNRFIKAWEVKEPKLVDWAEDNIPEGFNVFSLNKSLRKKLKTSNLIERMNQEIKRRTNVIRIFPNEASCLRLVTALVLDFHEDWIDSRSFFDNSKIDDSKTIEKKQIYRKKVA